MSLKDKLKAFAGDEVLGSAKDKPNTTQIQPKKVSKKTQKPKPKELPKNPQIMNLIDDYVDAGNSADVILDLYNIKKDRKLGIEVKSSDIDDVGFTVTQPYGFDSDEVYQFMSTMKVVLVNYERYTKELKEDLYNLAAAVAKREEDNAQKRQDNELDMILSQVDNTISNDDRIAELGVENDRLSRRVKTLLKENRDLKDTSNEISSIKADNDFLTLRNAQLSEEIESLKVRLADHSQPRQTTGKHGKPKVNLGGPVADMVDEGYDSLDDLLKEVSEKPKPPADEFDSILESME